MKYYTHRRVGSSGRGTDSTFTAPNQASSQPGSGFAARGRGRNFSSRGR